MPEDKTTMDDFFRNAIDQNDAGQNDKPVRPQRHGHAIEPANKGRKTHIGALTNKATIRADVRAGANPIARTASRSVSLRSSRSATRIAPTPQAHSKTCRSSRGTWGGMNQVAATNGTITMSAGIHTLAIEPVRAFRDGRQTLPGPSRERASGSCRPVSR